MYILLVYICMCTPVHLSCVHMYLSILCIYLSCLVVCIYLSVLCIYLSCVHMYLYTCTSCLCTYVCVHMYVYTLLVYILFVCPLVLLLLLYIPWFSVVSPCVVVVVHPLVLCCDPLFYRTKNRKCSLGDDTSYQFIGNQIGRDGSYGVGVLYVMSYLSRI